MKQVVIVVGMLLCSTPLLAAKPCEELGAEIAAKLDAKGVKNYTLEVVATDKLAAGQTVVGSCDAGKSKIVYSRGKAASTPTAAPVDPAPSPPPM